MYVGAVLLGFGLMALEDKTATERNVDGAAASTQPEKSSAPVTGTVRSTGQGSDLTSVRVISSELGRHRPTASAK